MQLNLLGEKSDNGFYLDFFEAFNWGVFDSQVYTMNCNKTSALLTGMNGSGKTTLVDAFLSLLVPPRQRFYNQSAGAEKKRERDEISYVLGTFGSKRDEEFYSSVSENLRTKENCFSILLACFSMPDGQAPITLMQMRYFSASGALQRVYSITQKKLSIKKIKEVTGNLTPQSNWKKIMTEKFNTSFYNDNFSAYAERFSNAVGFRSDRALHLFSQTVGLKGVGDLNNFIRNYMFEEQGSEKSFNDLVSHYEELSGIYNQIEKAQIQIKLLKNVLESGNNYEKSKKNNSRLKEFKSVLQTWYLEKGLELAKKSCEVLNNKILLLENKITTIRTEIASLDDSIDAVKASIEKNSTVNILKDLEHKIKFDEYKLKTREKNFYDYERCAKILSLEIPKTEKIFNDNLLLLPEIKKRLNIIENEIEKNSDKIKLDQDKIKTELEYTKKELVSLSDRSTNIPLKNIQIRKQICEGINCSQAELVFAGEILQVRESESTWEVAIEKLLHHFALCILVPPELYKAVNTFVASNNLKGRLVYFKTNERHQLKDFNNADGKNYLLSKLEIKKHKLSEWLEGYLADNFNFLCTDDIQEFQRAEKALTSSGLIKNKIRHEKDDRPVKNERQGFVLGWDNTRKRQILSYRFKKLKEQYIENTKKLNKLKKEQEIIYAKSEMLKSLERVANWDDLNTEKYILSIEKSRQEKNKLLQSDTELHKLEKNLKSLQDEKSLKEKDLEYVISEKADLNSELKDLNKKQKTFFEKLQSREKNLENILQEFLKYFQLENKLVENLESLERLKEKTSASLEDQIEHSNKGLEKSERDLRKKMTDFKYPEKKLVEKFPSWVLDVTDLQTETNALADFKSFYEKLITDDLPSCEKKFKAKFNEDVKNDIIGFKAILDNGKQDIIAGIDDLNKSLKTIPYSKNPHTYLRLEYQVSNDKDIKEFKSILLAAIPDFATAFDADKNTELENFKKIERLISYLNSDDTRRKKVLDVRNHFRFNAIEYYGADNTQKRVYDDSAGLSGGEKSKLTYTILASALAYQFGLTSDAGRSFRMVIIDEVFSKVDADNSAYAMQLFKEIGLQLILVTPMDKINLVEDFVSSVHITEKQGNTSRLLSISMERYLKEKK